MSSLVFQEIREFRSLAYTARALYVKPQEENYNGYLGGYIGCQADKTIESIATMLELIHNMPEKEQRMESIREALIQQASSTTPPFRKTIEQINAWQKLGFQSDPNEQLIEAYKRLTFKDIIEFNQKYIKDQPIIITIVGDAKKFDQKNLENFGKVIKIKKKELYNN